MDDLSKSVSRKRHLDENSEFRKRKKICLEEFFTESVSPEILLSKFHEDIKSLDDCNISIVKLKKLNKTIRQLTNRGLQETLQIDSMLKTVRTIINFVKNSFVHNFTEKGDRNVLKFKSNIELTLEACSVCLFVFTSTKITESSDEVNDVIFFLRREFDEINSQLSKSRDAKKITSELYTIRELLIENLDLINELVKTKSLNSLNLAGLLTSCIDTLFYHADLEVQMSALMTIRRFYKTGEDLRALIANLVFKSIGRVHDHYKFVKNYKVGTSAVTVFTILILMMLENVPILGFYTSNPMHLLQESFDSLMRVACFIITTFIRKVGIHSDGFKSYNLFLNQLVEDLITLCNEPEWPSARLILNLLAKPLTEVLTLKPPATVQLRMISLRILSEIITKKISDRKTFDPILHSLNRKLDEEGVQLDFIEFAQRTLIHHLNLTERTEINPECKLLHGILWLENIKHLEDFEKKMATMVNMFAAWDEEEHVMDLDKKELTALVYFLDTARHNYADHNVILKYVLYCCYDRNKRLRMLATQCLLDLATFDTDLLLQGLVSKVVNEHLSVSAGPFKNRACSLIDALLTKYPEKCEDYVPFLLRSLQEQSSSVKNICIDLAAKLMDSNAYFKCKTSLCYKILGLVHCEDPLIQKRVIDFHSRLWFDSFRPENLDTLLEMVDMPSAGKYLRYVFEDFLKSRTEFLTIGLVQHLLKKIENNEKTIQCLQILSIFVSISPPSFASQLLTIGSPLTRSQFSDDNGAEILTAEVLNCIIPSVVNPDVLSYVSLRSELLEKMKSDESLNYSMGLIVSILKLLKNLSLFDDVFLFDNCFEPSLQMLVDFIQTGKTDDLKMINRALCIAVHLHVHYQSPSFPSLLNFFIHHPIFGLTTIHCLCYLSMEYKTIMKNETVVQTVRKYLKDRRYPLPVKAVLHNILCSLKNIRTSNVEGIEAVKSLIQTEMAAILDCTIDERIDIRQTAYAVVKQLFVSGVVPEFRLIPSLLLMSTDPADELAEIGIELLFRIRERKLFCRNPGKCIIASLKFRSKCLGRNHLRGFRVRGGNLESVCNHFYILHQEEIMLRRKIIDSIMLNLMPESETTAPEKLYLADHLACFSYKYQEEIHYVLSQIELTSSTLVPENLPANEQEKNLFLAKYYGLHVLSHVKSYLMKCYSFNSEKLRKNYDKKDFAQKKIYISYEVPERFLPTGSPNLPEIVHQALKKKRHK